MPVKNEAVKAFPKEISVPVIDERPGIDLNAILYATDFSIYSQGAAHYAQALARYFSCKLLVVHAFTISQAALEVETVASMISQQRSDLQSLLGKKAASLSAGASNGVSVLLEGDPKDMIPQLAEESAPALIVLGTQGGGRIQRNILGSVAEGILRSSRWPCMTVGPQVPPVSATAFSFKRILYATDFTPAAAHAASFALSFAETFKAELDVLNVIQRHVVDHPDRLSELRDRFYNVLDQLVPDQAKEFCDPRTFVDVGDAHERILEHIREHAIDLLVLGLRKSSHLGMEARMSGAFQLIVDAQCPVLTVMG